MKKLLVTGAAAVFGILLLKESERVMDGVKSGLELCFGSVIPSLLVFMILADFLAEADLSPALFWPVRLVCRLFRVPDETAPVIAVSMAGGYPAGARMVGKLVQQGRMSALTGEKLLCSCICCSPSFLAGAVGAGLFGNVRFGLMLYGCQLAAMLVTGFLAGRRMPDGGRGEDFWQGDGDYVSCFVRSVAGAGRAVLSVCLFVMVFSAAQKLLYPLPGWEVMSGLLEVTVGCGSLAKTPFRQAVILSTVYTSLGGCCVWMQLYCFLGESGVRMRKFLPWRLVHCLFSLLFTLLLLRHADISAEVFSTFAKPLAENGSGSLTAALSLVMLCLMLPLTFPSVRKSCADERRVV